MGKDNMIETRYIFYTGKGGVGKTSVACATAINLTDDGKRVLLVSTDPASNLDDVLQTRVGQSPTPINGVPGLDALNLDPEEAARAYREQVVGSYRGILPDDVIKSIEEQLSGACTVEIASFDLFTRLLSDSSRTEAYDRIIFDTAPTGHTLRLLTLPKAWSGFLGANVHGASCIGPLAGLAENRERYQNTVAALANPVLTTLVLVTKPEVPALSEALRASRELSELGLRNQQLVVNCVLQTAGNDPVAAAFHKQQEQALEQMPDALKQLPSTELPLLAVSLVGIEGLRYLAAQLQIPDGQFVAVSYDPTAQEMTSGDSPHILTGLQPVVDDLAKHKRSVIMVMGKGGVGKSTVASAIALALAEAGHKVRLSTTDPAAHLNLVLEGAGSDIGDRFTVSRIDPGAEVAAYRSEIMKTVGSGLDEDGRALLAEDLASPCTEEIAVFRAFARVVGDLDDGFVVLDTAPTGHTLLLLDSTLSYHKEVQRSTGEVPEEVRQLLPRLRDPDLTHVMIVTLPQATPVIEASRLQDDLRRAGIEPDWWIVNQSWTGIRTTDPVLGKLAGLEAPWLKQVAETLSRKAVSLPWQAVAPQGCFGLLQLL
jgi:arsenite-transporting ATPase